MHPNIYVYIFYTVYTFTLPSNLVAHLHLLILMKVLTIWVLHFSDEILI